MAQDKPKFYGVNKAARILGVNRLTIRRWVRERKLEGIQYYMGNNRSGVIVNADDVHALAAGNANIGYERTAN